MSFVNRVERRLDECDKDIDDIHQEMVDKRFQEDESFLGLLMRKIVETEQGIKRQIKILDENIKLRK